jgi:hypothetical protein
VAKAISQEGGGELHFSCLNFGLFANAPREVDRQQSVTVPAETCLYSDWREYA